MPLTWPKSLVQELADRRCIVVLGAGASAACIGEGGRTPPLWGTFLTNAIANLIPDVDSKQTATMLFKQERYLDCAEIIWAKANKADFASFIRDSFSTPRFRHSKIHELILQLDPKVVITTNYDEIYDLYCREGAARQGYNVCKYYEKHALNDLRSPLRVILKAHGCVSNPQMIVLSRSQYFNARRENAEFYNILDGLFLVNTALFIGCSLTDPDMQLVLENVNLSASSQHPHYSISQSGAAPAVKASVQLAYNLELLEYDAGQHEQVIDALEEMCDMVTEQRSIPR